MAPSRRPPPGRRRSVRTTARARPVPAGRPADRRPAGLTSRAAVLGLVVCALVVSAALPLRELLSQRGDIAQLQAAQAAARSRVAALEEQQRRLQDPAYIAGLARDRLHFVRPGEVPYVVIAPTAAPDAPADPRAAAAPVGPQAPWYSQLWGSVRSADHPVRVHAAP